MTRTLIADADADCANSMAMFLSANGIETRAVYDGLAAVKTASEWRPATVVLDLYMPRLSGLEAAEALRAKFGREIQLVAYTAWANKEARERVAAAGFDTFVAKPSTPEDLLVLVSPELRATIERSMAVNARQIGLQMDLCLTYLDRAVRLGQDQLAREVARFVEERAHRIAERIVRQTLPGELREELQARLESLRRRFYGQDE